MQSSDSGALPPDDEEALKRRLLTRVGIAGAVVVALLGGLAVFDAVFVAPPVPQKTAQAPDAGVSADKQDAKEEVKEEPKVETKPEPPQVQADPAKPEPTTVAEHTGTTPAPPAPPASSLPLRPLTPPATARPAMIKPQPLAGARPEVPRDAARPPPSGAAPLSRPLSQAVASSRQFVLQMGVFSNLANAEELRAKLELNGIPAQIEARVQVGPFATKVEAEAARDRLRAIGMDNGILTAVRK